MKSGLINTNPNCPQICVEAFMNRPIKRHYYYIHSYI